MNSDTHFMRRAIALAKKGATRVRPNPKVGCVIVRSGRIVGEGYHAVFGGPHAEPIALKKAASKAHNATVYVTLEPCCHTGKKTPPCVPALIHAKVSRVVIGTTDPNLAVSGRGIRQLRRAGIQVVSGVLKNKCEAVNRTFLINTRRIRPYVILKAAASLDGRMETASGQSKWITSPQSRRASHRMRSEVDAILVGVETVLQDNPNLTAHGTGLNPLRVILDSNLRTPPNARVLNAKAPTLLMTSKVKTSGRQKFGRAFLIRVPRKGRRLDLAKALHRLSAMGVGTVLVEGGSAVHTSFLESGLIDEVRIFMAPKLIGGASARGFFEGRGVSDLRRTLNLSKMKIRRVGPDLLITGYVHSNNRTNN